MKRLIVAFLALSQAFAAYGNIPDGYKLPKTTISPDGHYGVLISNEHALYEQKKLIKSDTSKIVATLNFKTGTGYIEYGGIGTVWSKDSSLLVTSLLGKWGPVDILAIELKAGNLVSQKHIWNTIEKEILARLKATQPKLYEKIKEENLGRFTMDVNFIPAENEHRVSFIAGVTSDPNLALTGDLQLEATLKGEIAPDEKVLFEDFRAYPPEEIGQLRKEHYEALDAESRAYRQLLQHLSGAQKTDFENEESHWKAKMKKKADQDEFSFTGIQCFTVETLLYRKRTTDFRARLTKKEITP